MNVEAEARHLVGEAGLPPDPASIRGASSFEQIRTQITAMAVSGVLPPGTRLPAIRQLAADLGLAPGTVSRAYRELETTGVISARGRHGSYIAQPPTMTPHERASPREAILALQEVTATSRPAG
jgi:GntR family transcriptional regulator